VRRPPRGARRSRSLSAPPLQVYGLAQCSTCRRALAWLAERGAAVIFRDLRAQPLSPAEVETLAGQAGGAATLFSRRALQYRARGLHLRPLGEAEMLGLMSEEPTFITRPLVVRGGRAVAGFAPARLAALLAE
jgi:arsenate reductase